MNILMCLLLLGLIICGLAITLTDRPVAVIIIFMSYSVITSIIWMLLQSPDLAITEAAVGAGITTVMFFAAFKRMGIFHSHFSDENINDFEAAPAAMPAAPKASVPHPDMTVGEAFEAAIKEPKTETIAKEAADEEI